VSSTGKREAIKLDLLGACSNSSGKYYLWGRNCGDHKEFPVEGYSSVILLVDCNILGPILKIVGQG
jgi:hypothetical protein